MGADSFAGLPVRQIRDASGARAEWMPWRELLEQALRLLAKRDRELRAARSEISAQRAALQAQQGRQR